MRDLVLGKEPRALKVDVFVDVEELRVRVGIRARVSIASSFILIEGVN
jgi:hypothetical protein